jgi:hypothetical protein
MSQISRDLLAAHCSTIRRAHKVLAARNSTAFDKRTAEDTILALEPIAASIITNGTLKRFQMAEPVLQTGSLELARTLRTVTGSITYLEHAEWTKLINTFSPEAITTLLDENIISPDNGSLAVGKCVVLGNTDFEPLFDRIMRTDAAVCPTSPEMRYMVTTGRRPDLVAKYLRVQMELHQEIYLDYAHISALGADFDDLVRYWLAGLPPIEAYDHYDANARRFLTTIRSNHGALEVMRQLGSLEQTLKDPGRIVRMVESLRETAEL